LSGEPGLGSTRTGGPGPGRRLFGRRFGWLARFRPFPNPFRVLGAHVRFGWIYPLRGKRPFKPRAMCLYVTYRCNIRCQMCGIWRLPPAERGGEWSVAELRGMLSEPFFSRLEFVNLNGGEPNLREDLVEIAEALIASLPRLRNLTLNTNGLPPHRCVENCRQILALCRGRRIRFGVSVSLHRLGPAYDEVAGVPGVFDKVMATLVQLKQLRAEGGFYLSTNCVLTPQTLPGAEEMLAWGLREEIPVNFTVAEVRGRFNNEDDASAIRFVDGETRERLAAFLRRLANETRAVGHHAIRYRELAAMIDRGETRRLACHYALAGVIVGWDGSLFYCKQSAAIGNVREWPASLIYFDPANLSYRGTELIQSTCPTCLPNTFNSIEMQADLRRLARLLW
jgi:MoaA/NifB/PqqE/SkfB family radical SAM enzyme